MPEEQALKKRVTVLVEIEAPDYHDELMWFYTVVDDGRNVLN